MREAQRILVRAAGRVQGVGFRYFCQSLARTLQVSGWVRNLPGGDVELEIQGEPKILEEFLQKIKTGPPGALVGDLQTLEIPTEKNESEFEIRF